MYNSIQYPPHTHPPRQEMQMPPQYEHGQPSYPPQQYFGSPQQTHPIRPPGALHYIPQALPPYPSSHQHSMYAMQAPPVIPHYALPRQQPTYAMDGPPGISGYAPSGPQSTYPMSGPPGIPNHESAVQHAMHARNGPPGIPHYPLPRQQPVYPMNMPPGLSPNLGPGSRRSNATNEPPGLLPNPLLRSRPSHAISMPPGNFNDQRYFGPSNRHPQGNRAMNGSRVNGDAWDIHNNLQGSGRVSTHTPFRQLQPEATHPDFQVRLWRNRVTQILRQAHQWSGPSSRDRHSQPPSILDRDRTPKPARKHPRAVQQYPRPSGRYQPLPEAPIDLKFVVKVGGSVLVKPWKNRLIWVDGRVEKADFSHIRNLRAVPRYVVSYKDFQSDRLKQRTFCPHLCEIKACEPDEPGRRPVPEGFDRNVYAWIPSQTEASGIPQEMIWTHARILTPPDENNCVNVRVLEGPSTNVLFDNFPMKFTEPYCSSSVRDFRVKGEAVIGDEDHPDTWNQCLGAEILHEALAALAADIQKL
ncbi:hypothetical protein C8J57DRAFT_270380 [Mycena rebaudengoi]|nr:hypothetical protein C8J57DRAFT_270380 [Mycena rebaudengoi]